MLPLDFLKDRYDFELARKEHITGALTMPIGVVSGVGGLVAAMARTFTYRTPLVSWAFVPFLVADVFSLVVCLVYLARAYHQQTYEYLPLLGDLEQAEEEFRDFASYVRSSGGTPIEDYREEFRRGIIKAADGNTRTNEARSELLRIARLWLFAVLWLTAYLGVPYVVDQIK